MGVCNCSMFCCTLLYVHSSIAIIMMGKRELIALLNLSSWCLLMVERLFLAVPRGCLQFVIVVFPDHTHYFRARRSCETQLVTLCNDLAESLGKNKQADMIILDFLKAFDQVPHPCLLIKLRHNGIQGTTFQWIQSFLGTSKG